ncbi:MAG TPA: hypothetical protein VK582_19355 [Pyrinomonadaceae bacterium]|nr:hypothetical protein [Pyrinomonadaceae bacterium]
MLTQVEADKLILVKKLFVKLETISLPPGSDLTYELVSEDKQEQFLLDLWRGTFRFSKIKFQNRARQVLVLVRLDVDGSPHTNPDGQKFTGTHIHYYREGYDDRWAFPLDLSVFTNTSDIALTLEQFCGHCNIEKPSYQGWLT